MTPKNLKSFSTEDLLKQKKILTTIISIMVGLLIVYIAYFVYVLATRKWNSTNTLGIVSFALLGFVITSNVAKIKAINNELKDRNEM